VPTALVLLSVVPILGGAIRVAELSSGAEITPANARFFAMPVPVLLHIFGASVYCVVGAFPVPCRPAAPPPAWHRRAGRVLVLCGLTAALSGVWMAAFYPLPAADMPLVTVFRLFFGSAMAVSIAIAFAAIRAGTLPGTGVDDARLRDRPGRRHPGGRPAVVGGHRGDADPARAGPAAGRVRGSSTS
jgi:hypothetical protein